MSDRFGNISIQPPESSPPRKKPEKKPAGVPVATKSKRKRSAKAKNRVWPVVVAVLFALFAVYCSAGFFGVPYYITRILPKHFHEQTGMVLAPAAVTFNPFSFRFTTEEVRIVAQSGPPILSLQSLKANLAPMALWRRNVVCEAITARGLDLNIVREADGSYNFRQLLGAKKGRPLKLQDFSDLPLLFSLNNISIADSRVTFKDIPAGKTHTVDKIQLALPGFANIPLRTDQYLRPHFSAVVNGSPIELSGQTRMGEADGRDQATRLSMDIHDLDLTLYAGYLPFTLPMEIRKGAANGKVDLFFDPQSSSDDKLSLGFQLQLSAAELSRADESIRIAVPAARLNGTLQPLARTLHFTEIAAREPAISSFGKSLLANIKLPPRQAEQPLPAESGAAVPYTLLLDLLLVDNGIVHVIPTGKDQKPTSTWNDVQLSVKNCRFAPAGPAGGKAGSFHLSGEKDGTSTHFSWQGELSGPDRLTGNFTLAKVDGSDLLQNIGFDLPFTIKGVADLKGRLTLSNPVDRGSPVRYDLADTEVILEDFVLMDKDHTVLTAPSVKLAPLSLLEGAINFGNVRLRKAAAQFTYGKVPEPFSHFASDKYRLRGIDFEGKVTVGAEKKPDQQLVFPKVSLKANDLDSSSGKAANNLSVSGESETGGIFKAQGEVTLTPFAVSVNTGFRELPAKQILPFFTTSPLLGDLEGNLSGKGQLTLPAAGFSGELQLTGYTNKKQGATALSWQTAVFQDVNYTAEPLHLGIASTKIDQARFSWEITGKDNGPLEHVRDFFQKILTANDRQPSGTTDRASFPVTIRDITFSNGRIDLDDRRLTPNWQAAVVDFAGTISNIDPAAAPGNSPFSMSGKLGASPVTIEGAMDLFAPANNGSFRFSLENYPLAAFQHQLAPKTDIDPGSGRLQLNLDCRWQDRQYIRSGIATLVDVQPVDQTSDSALPLALLSGNDNTFQLPFDFTGTEPIAGTTLLDELLTAFQTLVVKGSVSPLLLAKGDFTDLVGNETIEFNPGEFIMTGSGRELLGRYGAFLTAHPRVGLVLSGGIAPNIDIPAMQQRLTALEQQRVDKENEKLFKIWQEKKALYQQNLSELEKQVGPGGEIVEQDIPADILAGFTPLRPVPVVVDQSMLLELGRKRIDILYQYLTGGLNLPAGRITAEKPDSSADLEDSRTVGVSITLKVFSQ